MCVTPSTARPGSAVMGVRKSRQPIRIAAVLICFPLLSGTFDSTRDRKVAAAQQRLVPECVRDNRGLLTLKCNVQCEHECFRDGVMNVPYYSSSQKSVRLWRSTGSSGQAPSWNERLWIQLCSRPPIGVAQKIFAAGCPLKMSPRARRTFLVPRSNPSSARCSRLARSYPR